MNMYRIVLLGFAALMLMGLAVTASGRLSATPNAQVAPTPAETQSQRPDQVGDYDPSLIPGMARVADKAFILRSAVVEFRACLLRECRRGGASRGTTRPRCCDPFMGSCV